MLNLKNLQEMESERSGKRFWRDSCLPYYV